MGPIRIYRSWPDSRRWQTTCICSFANRLAHARGKPVWQKHQLNKSNKSIVWQCPWFNVPCFPAWAYCMIIPPVFNFLYCLIMFAQWARCQKTVNPPTHMIGRGLAFIIYISKQSSKGCKDGPKTSKKLTLKNNTQNNAPTLRHELHRCCGWPRPSKFN